MKDVFILTTEPPEILGGLESFIREQMQGLSARGWGVRVFHRGNSCPSRLSNAKHPLLRWASQSLAGYFVGRAAQQAMHDEVAAVISHSTVGWYPLRVPPGCKQVHFYHGTYRGYAEVVRSGTTALGRWKMKWWDSMVLERFSGRGKLILCNSQQVAEEVRRYFGYRSQVTCLIMNERFRLLGQAECRRELGLPLQGAVGVFVGSLHPMKGFDIVQGLIDRFPEIIWLIVLRGAANATHLHASHVRVIQDAPHPSLATVYAAGDFSICPSVYEPFGYVVAEALLCGTPVVAAPGGASSMFLSEPPMDRLLVRHSEGVGAFATAVREVLHHPELYRRFVLEQVRPNVLRWMEPQNWWDRFFEQTGISELGERTGREQVFSESCATKL